MLEGVENSQGKIKTKPKKNQERQGTKTVRNKNKNNKPKNKSRQARTSQPIKQKKTIKPNQANQQFSVKPKKELIKLGKKSVNISANQNQKSTSTQPHPTTSQQKIEKQNKQAGSWLDENKSKVDGGKNISAKSNKT